MNRKIIGFVFVLLSLMAVVAYASLDIDTDANDATDIVYGGTNATSASDARTSLGLAIGSDVQAYDAFLKNIADLTDPNADKLLCWDDSASAVTFCATDASLSFSATPLLGIANDQVDSQHYAAGSIDLEHMSANSIDSDQYVDGSIDPEHLNIANSETDEYCLTYETDTTSFQWVECGSGSGDITAVGNCVSGDCFVASGTSPTALYFYDGEGNYVQLGISGTTLSSGVSLDHQELSYLDGVTSAIQTQFTNLSGGTTEFTGFTGTDVIDSDNYAADSIDNEHINWADIDYLTDEGAGIDEAYSSGWNADVGPPEKDDVYDFLHSVFTNDDATTLTVTGAITGATVATSGSNPYVKCTSTTADSDVSERGEFCMDTDNNFYYYTNAQYTVANTTQAQTLTNKTFDGVIHIPVCGDVDSASNTMFGNHVAPSGSTPPAACADQSYHHYTAFDGLTQDEILYIIFMAPPDLTGTDLGVRLALTRPSANPPTSGDDDEMRWLAAGCSILEFAPQTCSPGTDGASMEDDLEGATTQWSVIYSNLITFTVTNLAPNQLVAVRITRDVADASMTHPYQEDLGLTHVSILYSKSTTDSF